MNLTLIVRPHGSYVTALPDQPLLQTVDDAVEIIGFCWQHQVNRMLLHAAHLTPRFFDLSSQEAGLLLQKFQNYQLKLAVVVDLASTPHSRRFDELMAEEQNGSSFHIAATTADAETWLLGSA